MTAAEFEEWKGRIFGGHDEWAKTLPNRVWRERGSGLWSSHFRAYGFAAHQHADPMEPKDDR